MKRLFPALIPVICGILHLNAQEIARSQTAISEDENTLSRSPTAPRGKDFSLGIPYAGQSERSLFERQPVPKESSAYGRIHDRGFPIHGTPLDEYNRRLEALRETNPDKSKIKNRIPRPFKVPVLDLPSPPYGPIHPPFPEGGIPEEYKRRFDARKERNPGKSKFKNRTPPDSPIQSPDLPLPPYGRIHDRGFPIHGIPPSEQYRRRLEALTQRNLDKAKIEKQKASTLAESREKIGNALQRKKEHIRGRKDSFRTEMKEMQKQLIHHRRKLLEEAKALEKDFRRPRN